MMEILFKWFRFYLCLSFFQLCNGNPVNHIDTEIESNAKLVAGVISLLLTVCFLVFIVACLCCQRRNHFEQFRDSPVTASSIPNLDHGHVNPIANREFTIFSPLSPHFNNNVFHENKPKTKTVEDPLANSYDISPWFNTNEPDYPRTRLKYIKELGTGWFGKVVEGAIQDEDNKGQTWTPVVVRILEATSSQKEKILFLQNAEIYRIGNHANVLTLVGRSLETVPYLLLQEWCPQGDLKAYLRSQKVNAEQFLSTEYPLLWCYQLTSALKYIHEHDIVHLDLASRNCQLTNNLTLKLGDYGLGPFKYPADYYQGQPTVPVRWCSPESLSYTQTTIQPKRVTPEANVWALAVTMWEICECGEQPYWDFSDDEVISQVLGSEGVRLTRPAHSALYTDYLYRLMQLCWISAESRPKVVQIHIMLTDLLQVHKNTSSSDVLDVDEFDRRWESCKPNTIIKTDHIAETVLDSEGDDLRKSLSLSLTNLHGSLDNLAYHDLDTSTNEQSKVYNCEDPFQRMTSSGSETEEENWRNKVERGAYTEKVRQKSRSVADLMILTHVDYSESESETPLQSLEYRVNYKNVRLAGLDGVNSLENTTYGSEGNLLNVQDTFKEELRKLKEERRDSLLFVPDNISHSSFRNTETSSSRLMQELNSPVDIQPVNQVFNIYNVTIDNFSPIHMNKLSDILDVNSQLKPEWREVEKLRRINCELNQEIRQLEKLNQVQNVYSTTFDEDEFNQEVAIEDLSEIANQTNQNASEDRLASNSEAKVLNGFDLNQNVKESETFTHNWDLNNKVESKELGSIQNLDEIPDVNDIVDTNSQSNQENRSNDEYLLEEPSILDNNLNQNVETEISLDLKREMITEYDFVKEKDESLKNIDSVLEGRGLDCNYDGSEKCNSLESSLKNLTLDVVRNDDLLKDNAECEAFNFNIRLPIEQNETILRLHENEGEHVESIDKAYHEEDETRKNTETNNPQSTSNTENNQQSLEESILLIIDEIITRSLNEASEKTNNASKEKLEHEQTVNFDLSLSQEEVKPNSLTHSSLFTSSTPFKKRSLENKFSSMKLEENNVPDNSDLSYSLETWDNFLGSTLDHQNQHPENMFDSFSFEPQSLLFIEGDDGIKEKCDKLQYVENKITVLPDVVNSSSLANHNVDKKETSDVFSNNGDVLNSTYSKDEPEIFQINSEEVWNNYLEAPSGHTLDDYSTEPQSLIFIESEGVYKNCDDIKEVDGNKEDDDGKVGTSKDLHSTYIRDDILNTTYTKEESEVLKTSSDDLDESSFESGGGWFLHPQPTNELSGDIQVQSPSTDSYIGFGIDDEIMSAIRNELLTKLPHAQGKNTERVKEEDDWDTLEKNEVFLTYNVLSPIPEESFIEDVSGTNTPRQEETDWSGRTDTETITNDNETTSAHTLESPLRGTFNRHTPSQDSCCSNDTLFNLEDLICGPPDLEKDADAKSLEETRITKNDNVKKTDDDEIECSTAGVSKPQDIVNNFLTKERNYSAVVPLPSPEENPWKQLPASLLNYNQLTLSNSHSIKEEPQIESYSDCDSVEKQKICDVESIEMRSEASTEQEGDDSDNLNVTFTKDHPDVMELPDEKISVVEAKLEEIENEDAIEEDVSNKEPGYANVKEETVIENEEILYENSDIKNNENVSTEVEQFDDYVDIVNKENSKNRLESDVSDKDHTYINTYEQIDKEQDDSIYGILTDIRFTGPGDSQMMSTSFSENNDEQGWESGSDSRSSSSGEFIWREGEHEEYLKALRAAPQDELETVTPMEGPVENNYEESDLSSSFSDEEESPEFVPSAWDKFAMPSKSALRSPEKTLKKREEKKPKGVWFKKQKYHCIYEYPKEPESPVLPTPDAWKQPEFKVFTDSPSPTSTNLADDFFMTSSSQPFQTHNLSSQFFPGNSTWTFDNATPDSGMEDITPGSIIDTNEFASAPSSVPTLKQLASETLNRKKLPSLGSNDSLGGLRHTKKLLKLDLPPSPSAFSSDKMFTIEPTVEPVIREKPTFTTFGKSRFMVQHVETPPDASLVKNVSFEALPYKPLSPILDDSSFKIEKPLTIVDDLSRSDIDLIERNFIKNENDKCKLKVEVVRGEASVLDSGDEDSGIESTSTLERKISNPPEL